MDNCTLGEQGVAHTYPIILLSSLCQGIQVGSGHWPQRKTTRKHALYSVHDGGPLVALWDKGRL
ncbi:hypothetical protein PISMIDRAFT_684870 [Pisolithus microcarpus 441]|uniref:Uncharacterized protein n=1 Tax=Pisolithus microcarpus 441 TaxID=765257 RepID=A0A0C9YM37_9AGAM|nr:hypothetical protein PISMIDRAFT_684870 [Pisolithus microcarpus 441]